MKLFYLSIIFLLCCLAAGPLAAQVQTVQIQINSSSDDAEEQGLNGNSPGSMDLTSSDVELVRDGGDGDQLVGLRFADLAIPRNARIVSAYIQFGVDETDNTDGTVYVQVEDADDAVTFADVSGNISGRALLSDTVTWAAIPEWTSAGDAGEDQRTPSLIALVQAIVNRGGWNAGNAISFVLTGTGERTAEAFDGDASLAATLVVEYLPLVTETFLLTESSDDAEVNIGNGAIDLTSSDLELTTDGSALQLVALRYPNLTVPSGSIIADAYVQFTVDETNTGGTVSAGIFFETGNAAPISTAANPVDRDYDFPIFWNNIPDWGTLDVAGPEQRTPNLAASIQSVIDGDGWNPGNALLIGMIDPAILSIPGYTGNTSKRVAQSYDKSADAAAKLVVSYFPPVVFQDGIFPITKQSSWKYNDTGTALDTIDWTTLAYDDSAWAFGDGVLGYGNGNEVTTLDFGPDAADKYPTYYLRHTFSVDDAAAYDSLLFDVLRDDGVIVYLNGTELFRQNMPEGDVDYTTYASATAGGVEETFYFRNKTANLLQDGLNVIAVELHQASASSSDLSFDMAVSFTLPPLEPTDFPIEKKSAWHFLDDGSDLDGVDWTDLAYADADDAWESGNGVFGYGDPVDTEISFGPDPDNKYITTYFRKEINIDLATLPDSLELGLLRDDGAIVYVNGVEVRRDNLIDDLISFTTTATETVSGGDEGIYFTSRLYKADFRQGINTIAVRVHNRDVFSSDLAFDLYLRAAPVVNPAALGCSDGNEEHIACFTSIAPTSQTERLLFPVESHRFQKVVKQGDPYTIGGGNVGGNNDFTGYVGIEGSSEEGYLSINHETTPGGVSMLGLHYDDANKLWVVDSSQAVDFFNDDLVTTTRNCSGGITPWGTIITAEETGNQGDANNDGYTDVGWLVEIDPVTARVREYGNGQQEKLWAVGNVSHENALILDDEVTLFTGEDGGSSALFKFIADNPRDLSAGKLYVLQLNDPLDGFEPTGTTGTWLEVPNTTKEDRNNTRSLAIALGATNFSGIEDVEIDPLTGRIYFAAKGASRVYSFANGDSTVTGFQTFVGGMSYVLNTEEGVFTEPWGSGNDNLTFDDQGNLWVLQDGGRNYIWVIRPDHTQASPKVELFASMPIGSEPTGMTFSPDYRFAFFSVQHPSGANSTAQVDAAGEGVVFNGSTTVVISRGSNLGAQAPVADFTSDIQTVVVGESVTFTDLSENSPTTRQWVFDGGVPAVSSQEVETVTYNGLGLYTVRLTVGNEQGQDQVVRTQYIRVIQPAPETDFTANDIMVPVGQNVTFFDLSSNDPTSWNWTFEGGTPATSDQEMPTITYAAVGTYDVMLVTGNEAGSGTTETKTAYIQVVQSTGTEELDEAKNLAIFPNPTTGNVNLQMDGLNGNDRVIIELFDLQGRKLADLADVNAPVGTGIWTFDISRRVRGSQVVVFKISVDGKVTHRKVQIIK